MLEGSTMNPILDPIVSQFETAEQEQSYDAWVKAKVQASLDDPRPNIPHAEVMAKMEAIIVAAEERLRRQNDV